MTRLIIALCFFITSNLIAQESEIKFTNLNINALEFKIESVADIETLDWNDIKETFQNNDPESDITLKVILNQKKEENNKRSFSYKVDGKAKNIEDLIVKLKKGITIIKKITNKK
ncbi:MAG: hypothetical protein HWD82_10585 [Flavobacteriaceae bacterium]|nr:hypothetical protein [Flavobacteriaceae bacterium]